MKTKMLLMFGLAASLLSGCYVRERHPHHADVVVVHDDHHRHW